MIVEEFKNTGIMDKNKIFIHDKDLLLYKTDRSFCLFEVEYIGGAPYLRTYIATCQLTPESAQELEIVDFMMN